MKYLPPDLRKFLPGLPRRSRENIRLVIQEACVSSFPSALFLHGSHTRRLDDAFSDVDLLLVLPSLSDVRLASRDLPARIQATTPLKTFRYSEKYPWFIRLWTFYFEKDSGYPLDLGIITSGELSRFYVEPDARIIQDPSGLVEKRRVACYQQRLASRERSSAEIEFEVHHKTEKLLTAIHRGHLWNAIEHVSMLRRVLFTIMRNDLDPKEYVHVGRPERDIESRIGMTSDEWNTTIASYERASVLEAAAEILKRIISVWSRQSSPATLPLVHVSLKSLEEARYLSTADSRTKPPQ